MRDRIDGLLTETCSLVPVNPAGIAVGTGGMGATAGSSVNSAHRVSDVDLLGQAQLALRYRVAGAGKGQDVQNVKSFNDRKRPAGNLVEPRGVEPLTS